MKRTIKIIRLLFAGPFGANIQVIRPGEEAASTAGKLDRIPETTPDVSYCLIDIL